MRTATLKTLQILSIINCSMMATSLSSCDTQSSSEKMEKDAKVQMKVDSIMKAHQKQFYIDTTGISSCPVLITSRKIVEREYSNYRDIKLCYKNVSGKTITAIRFSWYGETAFNEPADMGGFEPGGGGGSQPGDADRETEDSAENQAYHDGRGADHS